MSIGLHLFKGIAYFSIWKKAWVLSLRKFHFCAQKSEDLHVGAHCLAFFENNSKNENHIFTKVAFPKPVQIFH